MTVLIILPTLFYIQKYLFDQIKIEIKICVQRNVTILKIKSNFLYTRKTLSLVMKVLRLHNNFYLDRSRQVYTIL